MAIAPKGLEGKARVVEENFNVSEMAKHQENSKTYNKIEGARILVGQKRALFNRATRH